MKYLIFTLALISFSIFSQESLVQIEEIKFIDDSGAQVDEKFQMEQAIELRVGMMVEEGFVGDKVNYDSFLIRQKYFQFVEVTTKFNQNDQKLKIEFHLMRKKIVKRVILNLPEIKDETLREEISEQGIRHRLKTKHGETNFLKGSLINADRAGLVRHYRSFGFPLASVDVEITQLEDGLIPEVQVQYAVKLNSERAFIRKIEVKGNKYLKTKYILSQMKNKKKSVWNDSYYNDDVLQGAKGDVNRIVQTYRNFGFPDAQVKVDVDVEENGDTFVNIAIEEGQRNSIKGYYFVSNPAKGIGVSDEEQKYFVKKMLTLKKSYLKKPDLEKDFQFIREYFGNRGYAASDVGIVLDSRDQILKISIYKGKIYYIKDIVLKGNYKFEQEHIYRAITFKHGEKFDARKESKSLKEIYKLGVFSSVNILLNRENSTVEIHLQEESAVIFNFGVGQSLQTGDVGGRLGFNISHIFWRPGGVGADIMLTEHTRRASIAYRVPKMGGSDYDLFISGRYSDREYDDFKKESFGLKPYIRKKITERLRAGLGVTLDQVDIRDASPALLKEDAEAQRKHQIVGLVGTLVYSRQKHNKLLDPTGGHILKIRMMPSYSDVSGAYARTELEAAIHKTVYENRYGDEHVISAKINLGVASNSTPFFDRYYAGGVNSIRGFRSRSLTGRNEVVGGKYQATGSVTYSIPVFFPELRMVTFVDFASVGNDVEEMGDVRVSAGAGLRFNMLNSFLKTSLEVGGALPLVKEESDEIRYFYFMLGNYDPEYDL